MINRIDDLDLLDDVDEWADQQDYTVISQPSGDAMREYLQRLNERVEGGIKVTPVDTPKGPLMIIIGSDE